MNKKAGSIIYGLVLILVAGSFYALGRQETVSKAITLLTANEPKQVINEPLEATPIPQAETSAVLSSSPLPETSLSPEATVEPTPTVAPVLDFPIVRDEIVTALLMYTYPMLEDYMADTVEVRIEGDTCCGVLPKEQVYANLEPYLQTFTGMWDFSDNEIDAGLRAQYPEHYATAIIGLMENEQAIGIVLNGEGKISKISMIQNYNNLLE